LPPHEKKAIRHALLSGKEQPLIIAVGRLVPVKAYDVLLRACVGVDAR
jgi:glycogen synthase